MDDQPHECTIFMDDICAGCGLRRTLEEPEEQPTIDTGDLRDLVLCHVSGFQPEWLSESSAGEKFGRTVSTKRVPSAVTKMIEDGCTLVIVQVHDG